MLLIHINQIYARHYESLSRGADDSPEKLERLLRERKKLYERHPGLEGRDPYYSPFLNHNGLDTGIRPAWETAGNRMQKCGGTDKTSGRTEVHKTGGEMTSGACVTLRDSRLDECLMLRVEDCRNGEITGYGVVLGDNNACYEKTLLLWKQEGAEENGETPGSTAHDESAEGKGCRTAPDGGKVICGWKLEGQYRPDLAENLPDQKNVALCGFWVKLMPDALPQGRYRIGMLARNRVSGLRLVNWSSRFVETGK